MATRKQKCESATYADTEKKQILLRFARPLSDLEIQGVKAVINQQLAAGDE